MHFSSALALARRPWPWPAGPSLGYASAEASGPRPGPLGLGRCLRKAFFSAHFSKAGLLILERLNIYSYCFYLTLKVAILREYGRFLKPYHALAICHNVMYFPKKIIYHFPSQN